MTAQNFVPEVEPILESIPEATRTDTRIKGASSRTLVLGDKP